MSINLASINRNDAHRHTIRAITGLLSTTTALSELRLTVFPDCGVDTDDFAAFLSALPESLNRLVLFVETTAAGSVLVCLPPGGTGRRRLRRLSDLICTFTCECAEMTAALDALGNSWIVDLTDLHSDGARVCVDKHTQTRPGASCSVGRVTATYAATASSGPSGAHSVVPRRCTIWT